MAATRRRKCRHCKQLYEPDPRNCYHQRYCAQPACRQASKATSQQRWTTEPVRAPSKKAGQRAAAESLLDLLANHGITRL